MTTAYALQPSGTKPESHLTAWLIGITLVSAVAMAPLPKIEETAPKRTKTKRGRGD